MRKSLLLIAFLITIGGQKLFPQSLAVNTDGSTANASALLDVKSTVKGVLIPRMTSLQRTTIGSPATGLQVYDTDLNQFYFYNGTVWTAIPTSTNNYWTLLSGNIYNNSGTYTGIGTSTPGDKLEVNGNIRFSGIDTLYAAPSTSGSAYSVWIRAGNPYVPIGGSGGSITLEASNNMPAGGSGYSNLGPSGNINLTAGSGYNTAGGNVNIKGGLTSCWASPSGVHADVNIYGGQDLSASDIASIVVQGGITVGVGCPTSNVSGGNIIIQSGLAGGSGSNGTIQLLNGNVGIGIAAPTQKLHVVGNICYTGSIAACSDQRYKTNITPIENPLSKVLLLQGVNYDWRITDYPEMNFSNKSQVGFIAQDLEKIFPELVITDLNGYKSIYYSRLTPVLVETIKEQQQQIVAITKRLQILEQRK